MDEHPTSSHRHVALVTELTAEITAAKYPVGGRFPTEMELQARFGVGRHTVREALKVLAEQGLLGRRRKTGTVVLAHRPVSHYVHSLRDLRGLFDFAQSTRLDIRREGFVATGEYERENICPVPDKSFFQVAGLRSTRTDGEPLCWSEILIPERFAPDREAIRRGDRAIYEVVMDQYALKLDYVEQVVSASALPRRLTKPFSCKAGTVALIVRRHYVAHTGQTFEISRNIYPSDRYSVRSVIRQRA